MTTRLPARDRLLCSAGVLFVSLPLRRTPPAAGVSSSSTATCNDDSVDRLGYRSARSSRRTTYRCHCVVLRLLRAFLPPPTWMTTRQARPRTLLVQPICTTILVHWSYRLLRRLFFRHLNDDSVAGSATLTRSSRSADHVTAHWSYACCSRSLPPPSLDDDSVARTRDPCSFSRRHHVVCRHWSYACCAVSSRPPT